MSWLGDRTRQMHSYTTQCVRERKGKRKSEGEGESVGYRAAPRRRRVIKTMNHRPCGARQWFVASEKERRKNLKKESRKKKLSLDFLWI